MGNSNEKEISTARRNTKLDKQTLLRLQEQFKQLKTSSKKNITKEMFLQHASYMGVYDVDYANKMFQFIDKDKSGDVDFQEFALISNLMSNGTVEEKINMIFKIWDADNSGHLSKSEMTHILTMYTKMVKRMSDGDNSGKQDITLSSDDIEFVESWVNRIFTNADTNQDGVLSLEEFKKEVLNPDSDTGLKDIIKILTPRV